MSRRSRKLAKVNRNAPGATSRNVDPATVARASNVNRDPSNTNKPPTGIDTGGGADWFGPQNPIAAMAPPEVAGRRWDFQVGYNLNQTTRPYEGTSFWELRSLADAYDVLRCVIETRKDQMEKLGWSIKPRTLVNGDPATSNDDPAIQEITDFLSTPDGVNDWGVWLRMLLEDVFVVDAPTLWCERTRGGKLLALRQLDGATIGRVLDDWGGTPAPPAPAFKQILKGMPAVYYTTDDLIYLPRNPRVSRAYGLSPVEQIVMIVNIGLRRELSQLQYYSEGNIPEALVGTPDDWNPSQITAFQDAWDAMLAGNQAQRRRIKFVPGGIAKTFVQTKEVELTNKTDEWLARVVCYCFSVPPTPFVTQMNRATANTAHDAALEEGLAPLQNWVKRLIDRVIRRFWPTAKVEFGWADDREVDPAVQEAVHAGYVTNGIKTINEVRDDMGLAPMKGGEKLQVKTATGYVEVGAPPPEPAPPMGAAPGPGAHGAKPKPGTPAAKPEKEAQAAKLAGGFPARKGYWGPPRHSHASHAGGTGGGE